jgi:hypothetical protein
MAYLRGAIALGGIRKASGSGSENENGKKKRTDSPMSESAKADPLMQLSQLGVGASKVFDN